MGLFDQILGAINNPDLQANASQLGNIVNTVQQLTHNSGTDATTTHTALSVLGGYVRSALQEKRSQEGHEAVQTLVNEFSGTTANPQAVQSLFTPEQQSQVIAAISQKTGVDAATIQSMLPLLVPVVLNFLNTGSQTQNTQTGSNAVLSNFLDADGDHDVDIADAMKMASQFLN